MTWPIPESGFRLEEDLDLHQGCTYSLAAGPDGILSAGSLRDYGHWKEAQDGLWLVEDVEEGKRSPWRRMNPFDHPTLHRRFAEIDDPEAALAFANRYGCLGRVQRLSKSGLTLAEPIDYWLLQARKMRVFVTLLDIAAQGETVASEKLRDVPCASMAAFGALVGRAGDGYLDSLMLFQSFRSPSSVYAVKLGGPMSGIYPEYDHDPFRYVTWARLVVSDGINAQFREGVHPMIEPDVDTPIYLIPQDLLGALYALLAEELLGPDQPLRKCPACGRWFRTKDPRRLTCSPSCKQKNWRLNKQRREREGVAKSE